MDSSTEDFDDFDPLYPEAVRIVVEARRCSISQVQRGLGIGYNRTARMIERMESDGIVSDVGDDGFRQVLVSEAEFVADPQSDSPADGGEGAMDYLDSDDEFFNIVFSQIEENPETGERVSRPVRAVTYAVMSWWVANGNSDTIDIADDSNSSSLSFTADLAIDRDDIGRSVSCFFEADEEQMLLVLFLYPSYPGVIGEKEVAWFREFVLDANLSLPFGALELYKVSSGYGLRYKIAACLRGVKVGKVGVVETLFEHGISSLSRAIAQLAD